MRRAKETDNPTYLLQSDLPFKSSGFQQRMLPEGLAEASPSSAGPEAAAGAPVSPYAPVSPHGERVPSGALWPSFSQHYWGGWGVAVASWHPAAVAGVGVVHRPSRDPVCAKGPRVGDGLCLGYLVYPS